MSASQLDYIVQRYIDKARIAEEALEQKEKQLSALKLAYNMQIDLMKALENKIDSLVKKV